MTIKMPKIITKAFLVLNGKEEELTEPKGAGVNLYAMIFGTGKGYAKVMKNPKYTEAIPQYAAALGKESRIRVLRTIGGEVNTDASISLVTLAAHVGNPALPRQVRFVTKPENTRGRQAAPVFSGELVSRLQAGKQTAKVAGK